MRERAARNHAIDTDFPFYRAQKAQGALGVAEAVEAARLRIRRPDSVHAHVNLPENRALARRRLIQPEPAGGQIRRDADFARMRRHREQIVQLQRFAAAQSDVEHAHFRQLVEDAAGLLERKRRALRRRVDITALAPGSAATREDDVHFGGRAQRPFDRQAPERRFRLAQLAHQLLVDVQQRARPFQLDDAAEPLGPDPSDPHGVSLRRSAPSITAIALAKTAPKRRNVTSTPSELEFGLQPNVACSTRPRRKGFIPPCYFLLSPRARAFGVLAGACPGADDRMLPPPRAPGPGRAVGAERVPARGAPV